MKEELPKILQIFYTIPWWLSFFLSIFLFLFGIGGHDSDPTISSILLFLSLVLFIFFIFGYYAYGQIEKKRLGHNPYYLFKKYPKDLEKQIQELEKQGFQVVNRTNTTANLERKPRFSWITFIVLLLLGLVLGLIYAVWYFLQDKQRVSLDISTQK